jgi:FKBP-type peptidyl-prolyl cis-trans isomerase
LLIGNGATAKAGDTVSVNYTGWLEDGTKFDSSIDRSQTFDFTLGSGQVIKGWDEGVAGMNVNGTRLLVIPPSLGYGSTANGSIPANSTLIFEVQLVAIK